MSKRLKNKNVLITGASAGIGEACAKEFAKSGSNLILAARRIERLERLKQELLSENPEVKIHTHQLDVRDKSSVDSLISSLPAELKEIDILVNNAGLVIGTDRVENVSLDAIDTMIDTNVKGLHMILLYVHMYCITTFIEYFLAGKQAYANGSVYCASKHAVNAISKTLLYELVDTPIRVTEINPGKFLSDK
ncbi:12453_t:CDS:2 [Acaulospora colombiana]|uniref:12453_t:CDS:1 n=1 Tax=Acaulospora colombiana TaxID=27376 RepID=A0ACA9KI97_9GLOM|nr:12453_t:CDS:2 [Acaulospora colombiana]